MTSGRYAAYKALASLALGIIATYTVYRLALLAIPIVGSTAVYLFGGLAILAILILSGIGIQRSTFSKGGFGISILGGKAGLKTIDKLSTKGDFWEQFAMWGLTVGIGVFSYFLVKGRMKKSTYLIGLVTLVLLDMLVVPYVVYGLQFISLPGISVTATQFALPNLSIFLQPLQLIELAITILFGFAGAAFFSIAYNAASILFSVSLVLSNPTPAGVAASGITTQIPGVAPVIPGITLPLFAGIISLVILLIVHEFSHGVLARRAKIKIKQIGVLLFGFVPIGGFVEPDEKAVAKASKEVQTNIFSAGIAANFLFMLIFFALTIFMLIVVVPQVYTYGVVIVGVSPGYPAYGVIPAGTIVKSWNGHPVSNTTSLEAAAASDTPNSIVTVTSNNNTYSVTAVTDPANSSRGLIGVSLGTKALLETPLAHFVYFLFTLFSLSMLLNFLVAVVNLLPIPGFDGWRIYMVNIKSARLVNTFGALIIILIVANIIPWAFHL